MKRLITILISIIAILFLGVMGAWAIPSSYQAEVWEGHSFTTPYITLGTQYSFDYWFEMTIDPPLPYTGQAFDALSVNEDGTFDFLGGVYVYTDSTDWLHATFNVPASLQGGYTRILFQVADYGPNTDPHVYLNNIPGVSAVPEPATMLLLGSGLIGLWGFRKKFKK